MQTVRVGLIGDYAAAVPAHQAIPGALARAGAATGCAVDPVWIGTPAWAEMPEAEIAAFDALWCVPASPYASMDGALRAIRVARTQGRPFLGTCGGFQHALIEVARDVLGLAAADHAESHPNTPLPLIALLACTLVEAQDAIRFAAGSRIRAIYGAPEAVETYRCRFGLNPAYASLLAGGPLQISGRDPTGEVRVIELAGHPFFLATLYQPERSALAGRDHPLITAFVQAAARATPADSALVPQHRPAS